MEERSECDNRYDMVHGQCRGIETGIRAVSSSGKGHLRIIRLVK